MKGSTWWREEVPEKLGDGYTAAIVEAIADGHAVFDWITVVDGDFEFEIMRAPLAIGEPDDFVFLLGLTAEAVDMIARALGDVMGPTPALWDLASQDARQVQVGPHTLPTLIGRQNGAAGMTKSAAKAHADALAKVPAGAFMSASVKCYALHPYTGDDAVAGRRARHACEYGWRLAGRVGWGSKASTGAGYVVQPPQWAHGYRDFWDYSMGGIYVRIAARHRGAAVNLAELALAGAVAPRVAPAGAVPFIVHPECRNALDGLSRGADTDPAPPPSSGRPLLVRGSKGSAVTDWQRVLVAGGFSLAPYGADGSFGNMTHNATVGWKHERGLPGDGVVDAATWAAIELEPIERAEPDGEITATVLATNFTRANRTTVDNVVIHTIEIVEASYSADRTAAWFASGKRAPRASANYCLDDNSTILCVPEEHVAWAAPGLNRRGIQLEHAGFARQSADEWFDPFSRRMLVRSAKLTAAICEHWNIPIVFVDAAGLLRGERGITTHYQVARGPGKGKTDHGDPGRGFPMSTFLDMVRT
jgi:hypothetical protein